MEERVYTITNLTRVIKDCLLQNPDLNNIWIKGEVSNLTYHSSGHIYLSLKDENSLISCIFFKYSNKKLNFRLEEGMSINAFGSISLFEKRGAYQFNIGKVQLEGVGELLKKIEQLKKKLLQEGLFDPELKKKIPLLPRRIGVVTSPTGAAIRDIIKVAMRRYPNIELIIAPAKVQGEDAAKTIVRCIEVLNSEDFDIDVIIVARGGGSFEDLLPFNEEEVIRAFYNSRKPIISAIGHQIDHPLCDEAADYAAPTPSAAAEVAVPVKDELQEYLISLYSRISNSINTQLKDLKGRINIVMEGRTFKDPMEIIYNKELLLHDTENNIISSIKEKLNEARNGLQEITGLDILVSNFINNKSYRFGLAKQALFMLSPGGLLSRGYLIATDVKGKTINNISQLKEGDDINLVLNNGRAGCSVNSVEEGEYFGSKEETN